MVDTEELIDILEAETGENWRTETDTPTLRKFINVNAIDYTVEQIDDPQNEFDWLFIMEDSVMSSTVHRKCVDSNVLQAFEEFVSRVHRSP